ncbi:MAG TPA: hypothetical protein DCE24_08240 [Porphyromonadaceae bacterium]|nr:hypothetical protein [Porphyromonadaceae bacterium]
MKRTDLTRAIHNSDPKTLRAAYNAVCEAYAQRFLAMLGFKNRDESYWISDFPGGVLAVGIGYYFVGMEEIVLAVDNAMSENEFDEWYQQWTDFDEEAMLSKPNRVNLQSWLMGARPDNDNTK